MMKKVLFLLTAFFFLNVSAQRTCGTPQRMEEFYKNNPQAKANQEALQNFLTTNNYRMGRVGASVVTIPIVVHVLYKNSTENISDAQILSQIKVLNEDFRKLNADFNTNVPNVFKPSAADMEIVFCLATKKADGSTTTGIERKSVASTFDLNNNFNSVDGLASWDTTKYLNIWVGAMSNGFLGLATLPSAAGTAGDGFIADYTAFGTVGPLNSYYNKGRTATHEIGHYFGLYHTWGKLNINDTCGSPTNDDYCADTPNTFGPYTGVPVFPNNSMMCTPTANGAMFMNFMDYTDDVAMGLFTNDQKTIVRNTLAGPRASLLNSNACTFLSVNDVEKVEAITVFPNPAQDYISISSSFLKINELEIFSADGRLIKKSKIQNEADKVDVSMLPKGVYFVRVYNTDGLVKSLKFIKK